MSIQETPHSPVWEAVAELEKQRYTRDEIRSVLFAVAAELNDDT